MSLSIHRPSKLIHPPAVLPYLTSGAGKGLNIAHPDHRCNKILVELLGAPAVSLDEVIGRAAIEENLVGVQQAPLVEEVLVVIDVEGSWSLEVERGQVVVSRSRWRRAPPLPLLCEGTVDVAVIVDASSERSAPGLPDGVSP